MKTQRRVFGTRATYEIERRWKAVKAGEAEPFQEHDKFPRFHSIIKMYF